MKRVTKYICDRAHGAEGVSEERLTGAYCRGQFEATAIVERLATIEDILGEDYDLDRLRELVQSDRDGRCVVQQKEYAPKKGDKVWYVDRENREIESGTVFFASYKDGKLDSFSVDFDCGDFDEFSGGAFGKCFFGSKESAEAALKGEQNGSRV